MQLHRRLYRYLLGALFLVGAAGGLAAALGALTSTSASATPTCTNTFENTDADGLWSNAADWSPSGVPNSASAVVCFGAGVTAVTYSAAVNSGNATSVDDIEGSGVTLTVSGGSLSVVDTVSGDSSALGGLDLTGGTFSVSGAATIGTYTQSGGVEAGAATYSVTTLTWSGGEITGTGSLTVSGASSFQTSLTATPKPYIESGTVTTDGSATFVSTAITSPGFYLYYGGKLVLDGSSTIAGGYAIDDNYAAGTLTVNSTLTDSGSSGSTVAIGVPLANDGTVNVPSGAFFQSNEGGTSTGAFSLAAGATLQLYANTLTSAASITGASGASGTSVLQPSDATIGATVSVGTLEPYGDSSGTTSFTGSTTAGTLDMTSGVFAFQSGSTNTITGAVDLAGGQIGGAAAISAGSFDWTSGYYTDSATMTVSGASTFDLSYASEDYYIEGGTIDAAGTATFDSTGLIDPGFYLYYGGKLTLDSSATIPGGYGIYDAYGAGALTVNGTLTDTGASGSTLTIGVPFANDGTLSVPAGAIVQSNEGGTSTGAFSLAAGATLELDGNTLTSAASITGASGASGTTVLEVINTSIAGTVSVGELEPYGDGTSTTTFSGSVTAGTTLISSYALTFNGAGTFSLGAVTLDGGYLDGSGVVQASTFNWSSGWISGSSGTITVSGATTVSTSGAVYSYYIESETLDAAGGATFVGSVADPQVGLYYGGALELGGTSTVPGGYTFANDYGANAVTVLGTLTDTGASGSTLTFTAPLDVTGALSVPAGATVDAYDGGTSAGSITLGAGSTLNLYDQTLGAAGVISGAGGDSGTTTVELDDCTINGTLTAGTLESYGTNSSTLSGGMDVGTLSVPAGTIDMSGASTYTVATDLVLDGGTIGGNGTITAAAMTWSSGDIVGASGAINVSGTTTVSTSQAAYQSYIESETLSANGGAVFESAGITDAAFDLYYSGALDLGGTSTVPGGYEFDNLYGAGAVVVEKGAKLEDQGASGSTVAFTGPADVNGTLTVPAGAALDFDDSGTSNGTISLGAGATFYGYDLTLNSTAAVTGASGDAGTTVVQLADSSIAGTVTAGTLETAGSTSTTFTNSIDVGALTLTNAQFTFNGSGSYTVTGALTLDGGTLAGSGALTVGTFDWISGDIEGSSGSVTVDGETTFQTSTASSLSYVSSDSLELTGGATFDTAGITYPGVGEQYGGSITLGGSSTIPTGYALVNVYSNGGLIISRGASLTTSGAAGTAVDCGLAVTNSGTLTVAAGTAFDATYDDGTTSNGTFSVGAGSTLELGDFTLGASGAINSAATGTISLNEATLSGPVNGGEVTTFSNTGVTFDGGATLASLADPAGTVSFDGTDSYSISGAITVDGGTLGGSATVSAGSLTWTSGNFAGTAATLSVTGATTISTDESVVVAELEGWTINANGGLTETGSSPFPGFYAANTTINLSGTSSIAANVTVSGSGSLDVGSTASLTVGGSAGTTELALGITNAGSLTIPASSVVDLTSDLSQSTGATTTLSATSSELIVPAFTLSGGTLEGSGTIAGPVTNTAGTVEPGSATASGLLTVVGSYDQAAGGTLVANLGGATAGTGYGQLQVATAELAGTLDVDSLKAFVPSGEDLFAVVNATTSLAGTFTTITPTGFTATPQVNYTSTQVQLSFAAAFTPTVKVTATAASTVYGQPVTFTATVTGSGPGATGTVQFMDGSADLGSPVTLVNGVATYPTAGAPLPVGSNSITGVYSGDSNYKPGTSSAYTETVAKVATTMVFAPSVNPAGAGQSVSLIATVTAKSPSTAYPVGSVTFDNGTKKIGTATLSNGVATLKTTFAKGSYTLKASYAGNSDFGASSGSSSESVLSNGTKTTLTESATRVLTAVGVTFTATVKADSGSTAPTGDVVFYNGTTAIGKGVKLSSKGVATATYPFAHGGTLSITARYEGSKSLGGSVSNAETLVVQEPGYRLAGQDGGVFDFGGALYYGSLPHSGIVPATPVVGIAATPDGEGYWLVTQGAVVYPFGDAKSYSADTSGTPPNIVAMLPTADGKGYWLIGDNGSVWPYGDAVSYGQKTTLTVAAAGVTTDGKGYWEVTTAGKVYAFGDAKTEAVVKGQPSLSGTISAFTPTIDGKGYYVVNTAGDVWAYGDAKVYGDAKSPTATITGIAEYARGTGYWLVGADGSVYHLGSAPSDGSVVGSELTAPISGTSAFP